MNPMLEIRIYEFLGITLFRKLVLFLERLIHQRDKGTNINYHIPSKEIGALDAFVKYLFYNGTIHARNLLFFSIYAVLKVILRWHFGIYDIVFCALALKDLYCVMLQRYNFLRIELFRMRLAEKQAKRKQKAIEKSRDQFATSYDFSFAQDDLALIQKVKACIQNRESIILSETDIAGLDRLLQATEIPNDKHAPLSRK